MRVRCKNCGDWTNIGHAREDRTDIGRAKLGWCSPCWKQARKVRAEIAHHEITEPTVTFTEFGTAHVPSVKPNP